MRRCRFCLEEMTKIGSGTWGHEEVRLWERDVAPGFDRDDANARKTCFRVYYIEARWPLERFSYEADE